MYQPKLPRWKHQDAALARSRGREAFAYFMEMRTGKTKCVLDEFGETEHELPHLLVIAPAGVYRTWLVDAEKHLSDDLRRRARILLWDSGANFMERQQLFKDIVGKGPKILLINIEALSTVLTAQKLCAQFIKSAPTMMVIDESTTIKSLKASRTRFCLAAAPHAKRRRILSGLPSPQSPLDLYTQCMFLDQKILGFSGCKTITDYRRGFAQFQNQFAIMKQMPFGPGRRMISTVAGYRNLDQLSDKIKPHAFRVKLSECYDLPEKLYMRRDVTMTDEQERIYGEIQTFARAFLDKQEKVTATIVLTQLLRFQQVLAGFTTSDNGNIVPIPENKTDELLAALEGHRGKAVIWVAFDHNVRKLTDVLRKEYGPSSVARFWGANANEREAEEKLFLTDPNCRFMIATAASGGRGRTWAVADLVVYYSNTFSLEHRLQSEERTQGVGKVNSVAYLDLVHRGTVEEKILHALKNKIRLSDAVTGDKWRQWVV